MATVVIVAGDCFPPVASAGLHRVLGWARFLPERGWETIVLTLPTDYCPPTRQDPSLLASVPPSTEVRRVTPLLLRRLPSGYGREATAASHSPRGKERLWHAARLVKDSVLVPDTRILWVPPALQEIRRIARARRLDAILTTSPENSSQLVGLLASRALGLPWVADFRDPWISTWHRPVSRLHANLNLRLARLVASRATHMTVVSRTLGREVRVRYGADPSRVSVITNGFDPVPGGYADPPADRFTIVHTGRFYGRRSPRAFLEAVRSLVTRRPDLAARLRVRLIGDLDRGVRGAITPFLGADWLEIVPPLAHREALQAQHEACALLLIPGTDSFTIPGKLFEYLAAGRPILALCQVDSDTAHVLRDLRTGLVVEPEDVAGIARGVLQLMLSPLGNLATEDMSRRIASFTRAAVSMRMADVLDRVVGREHVERDGRADPL